MNKDRERTSFCASSDRAPAALLLALGFAVAPACAAGPSASAPSSEDGGPGAGDTGAVSLALDLGSGVTLSVVEYQILGAGGAVVRSGAIHVANSTAASTVVVGVPSGSGYTVQLSATSDDGSESCGGASAIFSVSAGRVTSVSVLLECRGSADSGTVVINGTTNVCPQITSATVDPAEVTVGGTIALSAVAIDPDNGPSALTYAWSASGPGAVTGSGASASFVCTAAGPATIALTVSDGDPGCDATSSFPVTCGPGIVVADSDAGSAGTDSGAGTGTGPAAVAAATSFPATGQWAKAFGLTLGTFPSSVATLPDGSIALGGYMDGAADFGNGPFAVPANDAGAPTIGGYIAVFAPDGTLRWSRFLPTGFVGVTRADASGNVFVAGLFSGTADFGGGPLPAPDASDGFVAKYSSAGVLQWVKTFNATATPSAGVTDAAGDLVLVGSFDGQVDFGTGPLAGPDPSSANVAQFIVKFAPSGTPLWAIASASTGSAAPNRCTMDPNGNVFVVGLFSGSVDLGGINQLSSSVALAGTAGKQAGYLVKYTSAGSAVWALPFASDSFAMATGVGSDAAGNAYVTGSFGGTLSLGGAGSTALTSAAASASSTTLTSAGAGDVFLAKVDPSGALGWSQSIGDPGEQEGADLAVDGAGNTLFDIGCNSGSIVIGATDVPCPAMAVARFDGAGNLLWARGARALNTSGTGSIQTPGPVTLDPSDDAVVTATFGIGGTFDVVALSAAASPNAQRSTALVKLSP